MKNLFYVVIGLVFVFGQYSCKKDKENTKFCKLTSWSSPSVSFNYTYDDNGFVKRGTIANGTYYEYTQTANVLQRQGYTAAGVPSGSPAFYQLYNSGLIAAIPNSSDTTFLFYNNDQQLSEVQRRNDTIISRTVISYVDGDATNAVEYRSDSSVRSISTYAYYNDKENHTNLSLLFDILDSRYGKPCKHHIKSITQSSSGSFSTNNFFYTFDSDGNPVKLQLLGQPSNSVNNLDFSYSCN